MGFMNFKSDNNENLLITFFAECWSGSFAVPD